MPSRSPAPTPRSVFIDGLKALASLLIVAHHLAFYGPMAHTAGRLAPEFFEFLARDARMVVQIFLVIGGFMAARTLAPKGRLLTEQPWATLGQRAARLVVPYWFALGLTIIASHLASLFMDHPSISPPPGLLDLALNLLLLSQIAGRESLSAGAWYVAIDLQLFALTLAILGLAQGARHIGWTPRAQRWLGLGLLSTLTVAALFVFNLDAELDAWALYFMGAYGLGMAAWWFSQPGQSRSWFVATLLVASLALSWAWRDRLVVALLTAAALFVWRRHSDRAAARVGARPPPVSASGPIARLIATLGTRSYALFLVHFPVCLVVNSLFTVFAPPSPVAQLVGVVTALAASLVAARFFYDWVEAPVLALTKLKRSAPGATLQTA